MDYEKYNKVKSFVCHKKILVGRKGDKDYTESGKQLLISLINDYSLFGGHDHEIIQILSKK